jgi:hypothetical protein
MKVLDRAPLCLCVSVSLCFLTYLILASDTGNRSGTIPKAFPFHSDLTKDG